MGNIFKIKNMESEEGNYKIKRDPASKHLYTLTSTKLIMAVIFLGLLLMLLASMAGILSNTKFGKFERLINSIEEDLEKTSNLLLDNVLHKNEYQRKVYTAKKGLIDAGKIEYEITKPDLTKEYDVDPKILNNFNQGEHPRNPGHFYYEVLVSLYMTKYEIDSYDQGHSLVAVYDRQTKKINLKG